MFPKRISQPLLITYVITVFLMVFYSPFTTIYWVVLVSIYFLYNRCFMYIVYIWVFYFGFWYILFTLLFFDFGSPIIIGGDHTRVLMNYIGERLLKYPFLGNFTIETIMVTHIICEHYNTTVYIPSLIGGFVKFLSFLFGGGGKGGPSVKCSPEKGFKGSSSPGTSSTDVRSKTFFSEPSPASPIVEGSEDIRSCNVLTELLSNRKNKLWYSFIDWESKKASSNKSLYVFRISVPNSSIISKNFRGTKVGACAEFEGPIVEILS